MLITGVMAAGRSTVAQALRERTARLGLWLDTSGMTTGETVEAVLAGRERARIA